jgi:hypothetical protein
LFVKILELAKWPLVPVGVTNQDTNRD